VRRRSITLWRRQSRTGPRAPPSGDPLERCWDRSRGQRRTAGHVTRHSRAARAARADAIRASGLDVPPLAERAPTPRRELCHRSSHVRPPKAIHPLADDAVRGRGRHIGGDVVPIAETGRGWLRTPHSHQDNSRSTAAAAREDYPSIAGMESGETRPSKGAARSYARCRGATSRRRSARRQGTRCKGTRIDDGVPSCAITTLHGTNDGWTVASIAATHHLQDETPHLQP
jgi:hypothetical protein